MLKASVSVTHDLCHAFQGCSDAGAGGAGAGAGEATGARAAAEPVVLVLKKWRVCAPARSLSRLCKNKSPQGAPPSCQKERTRKGHENGEMGRGTAPSSRSLV